MPVDAPILRDKICLDEECMIPHLAELNQNHVENRSRHIHGECGNGRQHAHARERIECVQVGAGKNIADLHKR